MSDPDDILVSRNRRAGSVAQISTVGKSKLIARSGVIANLNTWLRTRGVMGQPKDVHIVDHRRTTAGTDVNTRVVRRPDGWRNIGRIQPLVNLRMAVGKRKTASYASVHFTSAATNLVRGDTNYVSDVFVRDLQSGALSIASVSTNGGVGNGNSYLPNISSDGRYVLFCSQARNLAPGSYTNDNLFLRDLQAGQTYSLTTSGYQWYSMTPNGGYVAFVGSLGASSNLYVWNSSTATTIYTNVSGSITNVSISPDAHWIVYVAGKSLYIRDLVAGTYALIATGPFGPRAGLKFSSDSRFLAYAGTNDVYLQDLQFGTNVLVSHAYNSPSPANGPSDSPVLSADGRFVAYRSFASNCIASDLNGCPDIFLFDRLTGSNILASANFSAVAGNNRSLAPIFSADGQTLFLESWASDLINGDFNLGSDLFALNISSLVGIGFTNPPPPFVAGIVFPGNYSSGQPAVISWPYVSGHTYTIQYKDNLTDPVWQILNEPITVNGSQASTSDASPSASQRFYRIVQN